MLTREQIKDYLVNSFEHENSLAEALNFLTEGEDAPDLIAATEALLKSWAEGGQVRYQMAPAPEAEKYLDQLINQYWAAWL